MKTVFTLIFLVVTQLIFAQYGGKDPERVSRFRPGFMWHFTGGRPAKPGVAPKYDRVMVDLTYNTWANNSEFLLVKPGSVGFNMHVMKDIPITKDNGMGLGIGLSYRHQSVHYNGELVRNGESQSTVLQLYTSSKSGFDRSKFVSNAVAVPVELRFRYKHWRHVKIHAGGYVGYRFSTSTKQGSSGSRELNRHFYDENPFFYGMHVRVGIRNLAFFADYCLATQFKSAKSTALYPVAIGITLSLF